MIPATLETNTLSSTGVISVVEEIFPVPQKESVTSRMGVARLCHLDHKKAGIKYNKNDEKSANFY